MILRPTTPALTAAAPSGGQPAVGWDPQRASRVVGAASAAALLLAAGAGLCWPAGAARCGPAALVIAGVLSLPHGAVDHLALGWARGRTGAARPAVLVGYAAAALAAAVTALAAPLPALLALLALSVLHFAEGERAFDRLRGGAGPALPALGLACAVVAVPLLARPAASAALLRALDPALPAALAPARLVLLAATAVIVLAATVLAVRARRFVVAIELALVSVAALVGPAVLVFAVWFGCWHSPRHLVRLAALEPVGTGAERLRRLAVGAAAPTAVAMVGLVALAVVSGGLPAAVLVVLLALTVPHAAVVARLGKLARR